LPGSPRLGDIDRIEINEAFAVIAIVVMRELGLPEDIVNVEGGAIAHGHPIGTTGAVLTTRLIHSMRRDGLKRGIVTLCIGGRPRHRARTRDPLLAATLAGPARVTLGAQNLFQEVSERGLFGCRALNNPEVEIGNGAEPQFPGQLGQAMVL
jgi:hypothetical protein